MNVLCCTADVPCNGCCFVGQVISSASGTSAGDCCNLCKSTTGCASFSFDLFSSDHTCSLHSAGAASSPSTEHVSGTSAGASPSPHKPPPPAPHAPPHPAVSPSPSTHPPAPHYSPAPGPPGPPLPASFSAVPGVAYAGVDNSVFARGFDAVAAEAKLPVVLFTTHAQPERLWAPPQFGGIDVVQVPDQVSVFTLPANQYAGRGAYLFNYSEVETFENSSSHSVVSELLYNSFSTSFYE